MGTCEGRDGSCDWFSRVAQICYTGCILPRELRQFKEWFKAQWPRVIMWKLLWEALRVGKTLYKNWLLWDCLKNRLYFDVFHSLLQACSTRQNASSAEHQSNEGDQSESSSDDDSDQSESSSDESISLPDKLAKRKSSQCPDDSMDTKKLEQIIPECQVNVVLCHDRADTNSGLE